jgi:integrase
MTRARSRTTSGASPASATRRPRPRTTTARGRSRTIQADKARGQYRAPAKVTFREAAEEWFRHGCHEGGSRGQWKPSTRRDYRSCLDGRLLPAFGDTRLEQVTARAVAQWRGFEMAEGRLPRRTAVKLTAILHGIFERARRAYDFPANPIDDVEPLRMRYDPSDYDFYSQIEVRALVRAAGSDQDGAIFLTAAFAGLRLGELLALRVRDVDFEREALRVMGSVDPIEGRGTTKGGKGRTVPMVPNVQQTLARLLQRERCTGDDDPLFPGEAGGLLDGSALRRRFKTARKRAGLRELRFHDLRHTFGSLAIDAANIVEVQAYMGHADVDTTMRYLHYKSRVGEAARLATAFADAEPASGLLAPEVHNGVAAFHETTAEEAETPATVGVRRNETEPAGLF